MLKLFTYLHFRKKDKIGELGFTGNDEAFKSRLIQLVLTLSLLYLMVIIVFSVSGIQLTKAASATCLDIKGQGTQVLVGGVANSGVLDFDDPGIPFAQEACVEDPGNDGVGPFLVKGWAWDTNLGWVSMYCSGGSNLGAACGGIPYGVTINDNGEFDGYAWGDGSGWISFNNGASSRVRVEVDDPSCQGYIYGFTPPKAGCPVHGGDATDGLKWTYAWSDNVKWIDLDGVIIPWFSLVKEVNDVTISVEVDPNPFFLKKNDGSAKLSDGTEFYTITVHIKDDSGDYLDDSRYSFVVNPIWSKDTVKKNQTNPAIELDGVDCNVTAERAVDKPCQQSDMDHNLVGRWSYDITSIAPTSNMNGILNDLDIRLFSYENFITSDINDLPLESNDLYFRGADISVYDDETDSCVFGDVSCNAQLVCTILGCTDVNFKFRPRTEVTELEQDDVSLDEGLIDMTVGVPESFTVTDNSGPGIITYFSGVENPSVAGKVKMVNSDDGGDGFDWDDLWNGVVSFTEAVIVQDPTTDVPSSFGGLYIYSKVTEGAVSYFSNKLPRMVGSSAVQPVAMLKGNVYTTGSSKITTAAEAIRSLGDVSTNILRDTIYKNVSSIVAGATEPTSGGSSILLGNVMSPGILTEFLFSDRIIELMPDLIGPRVYYAKGGDVHLGNIGSTLIWSGNRTVIVVGGNVYIDANLYNGAANPKPKLGIIALKDLSSATADAEGHVYIHKDVQNIQANIFADGSVFSYDDVNGIPGGALGEPQWISLTATENALKYKQLLIEGSVASQNTIGGSGLSQPIKGDGTWATGIEQARLYDLNFLRYYTGLVKRGFDLNPAQPDIKIPYVECKSSGVNEKIYAEDDYKSRLVDGGGNPISVWDDGCLWPPEDLPEPGYQSAIWPNATDYQHKLGATYINFDPPSADLPGFTAGSGVDVKVRPR